MALNVPEILVKLVDNANLGKVVTDVGAGLALSIPFVMLLGTWTGISVLPADRLSELAQEIKDEEQHLAREQDGFRGPLEEAAKLTGSAPPRAEDTGEMLYSLARRQAAHLAAMLEVIDKQIDLAARGASRDGPSVERLSGQRTLLASLNDRLISQREAVDEILEHTGTLRNRREDAGSLVRNVEVFTDNLSAVLAFSVIFGVLLSQIQRLVFVDWIYDQILKRRRGGPTILSKIRQRAVRKKDYSELVSNYYRYVEGSINMIPAVLLFGLAFPQYANQRLALERIVRPGLFLAGSAAVTLLLAVSGFFTYRRFREKEEELASPK